MNTSSRFTVGARFGKSQLWFELNAHIGQAKYSPIRFRTSGEIGWFDLKDDYDRHNIAMFKLFAAVKWMAIGSIITIQALTWELRVRRSLYDLIAWKWPASVNRRAIWMTTTFNLP